jgi:hypothetical protein
MKKLLLFVTFLISGVCCSQDNTLEETIKKEVNYKDEEYHDFVVKVLPHNPALAIGCATKYNGEVADDGFNCDLILLLIDTKTEKIISRYTEEDAYQSDAYQLSEVGLDMANYKVSDNLRAFGVRSHFSGSSRVYPSSDTAISLFIIKNNKIEKILNQLEVKSFSGDWDTNCHFDGEEVLSILIMQKEKNNGFFNIQVKTVKTIRKARLSKSGDCIDSSSAANPIFQTLEYVNGEYQLRKPAAKSKKT